MPDTIRLNHLSGAQKTAFIDQGGPSWLHDASNPYWDWLWGSETEALAQLRAWLDRPGSEIFVNRIRCISDSHDILGGYIALGGQELQQCRKADFLSLVNHARRSRSEALMLKMDKAKNLFSAVTEDEFYLSRIGVERGARGRGIGKQLMKAYIDSGTAKGFRQFRLDVDASNLAAIQLYRAFGFNVGKVAKVPGVPFQYCSMTVTIDGGCSV
jgi:ribosomal protein S18 acetylase RimI-like enzyme